MKKGGRVLSIFFLFPIVLLFSACDFTQYIAHYANQYGWRTKLTIRNGNLSDTDLTLEFYDNDGNKVSTVDMTLKGGGFTTDYVENFFPDSLPETGSIKIISHEPGFVSKITSIILFEYGGGKSDMCMGGLQGAREVSKYLSFPWFENSSTFTTGIAILNVSGHDVVATMRANTEDGNFIYSKPIKLKPMQRIIGFPSSFFNETIPNMSTLDVFATGDITGFIIMYNNDITKAEAINGVINRNNFPENISYKTSVFGKTFDNKGTTIKLSRDLDKLYVFETNKGIYAFDKDKLSDGDLIYSKSVFGGTFDVSPDGKTLVVADWAVGELFEIDLENNTKNVIDNVSGVNIVTFSNDGNYLAIGSSGDSVVLYEVDLENHSYIPFYSLSFSGGDIKDIIFSNDSRYLIMLDGYNSKLLYKDLTAKVDIYEKDLNMISPNSICQSEWNDSYYICGGDSKICVLSDLSSSPSYISTSEGNFVNLDVSKNGKYLYLTESNSSKIVVINLFDNNSLFTIDTGYDVEDVVYSPDDLLVYFSGKNIGYIY